MIQKVSDSARRAARSVPRLAAIGARYYLMFIALQFLLGLLGAIALSSMDYDLLQVIGFLNLNR